MEQYKSINAELIAKIQEMKLHIADYQKQIVESRLALLEEHRKRIEAEQLLAYKLNQIGKICFPALKNMNAMDNHNCSLLDNQRKSSDQILLSFRRSNIHQTLQTVSPTRRRSSTGSLPEGESSPSDVECSRTATDIEDAEGYCSNRIIEENEEEEEESSVEYCNISDNILEEGTLESSLRSVELNTSNNCQSKPLREITNEKGKPMSDNRKKIATNRIRRSDNSDNSFEIPRSAITINKASHYDEILIGPSTPQNATGEKKNICSEISTSYTRDSDLKSWNILDAKSSTPKTNELTQNNKDTSLSTLTNDTGQNISDDMKMTKSARPRRQCTPKTLAEPLLNAKLRNDHGKSVVTKRSKSNGEKNATTKKYNKRR